MQVSTNQLTEYRLDECAVINLKVCISKGNSKLGNIPNVSLPAGKACALNVPCRKDCYANKGTSKFPNVQHAWEQNYIMATNHRELYFNQISEFFKKSKTKVFRWHVSGDILDQNYLLSMISITNLYRDIKFLAFTKMYHLDFTTAPSNLQIVFSAWPNFPIISTPGIRIAWMQDGTETRIPQNSMDCPGSCTTCKACWNLKSLERDVVFHKH